MKIHLSKLNDIPSDNVQGVAFFQLGFRPCFMLASIFAMVSMLLWLLLQQGWHFPGINHYTLNYWHAHEMVFSYGLLVIAGFLLTAIKNWTGVQTVHGKGLMLLVLSWLVARVSVFIPGVSAIVLAVLDCVFPFLLIFFVAKPLFSVGNKRNYMMVVIVGVMALLNSGIHISLIKGQMVLVSQLLLLALMLVILLMSIMAGRIFAVFSQNGVEQRYQTKTYPLVEKLIPFALILLALFWVIFPHLSVLLFTLAVINLALHGLRLIGWYNIQIWQKPLVWVLHVGYGFLVLGFAFVAVSAWVPAIKFIAIHVFTVGSFGLITLGMMARVSYGHTGRNLHQPPKILGLVFVLLTLSALVRVLLPLSALITYKVAILVSGLLWTMAFTLFMFRYVPIWLKPRVDGKPG